MPHRIPGCAPSRCRSSALGQAPGDCHRRPDGRRGRPRRPLQLRRSCASRTSRTCCCRGCTSDDLPALWAAARKAGLRDAEHRPADRHDRLPRRRLLLAGQRALDPDRRSDHRALPGPRRAARHRRDRPATSRGCINSCGHHHVGHIGILGVDKDGKEWYQVTLGGSDGSTCRGPATPGKVIGPSFAADEVPDVIEAADRHLPPLRQRAATASRDASSTRCAASGIDPFKAAANAARFVRKAKSRMMQRTIQILHRRRRRMPRRRRERARSSPTTPTSLRRVSLDGVRPHRAELPEVHRRPRLQPGLPAAPPPAASRATSAPPATCWSTSWCRCSARGFSSARAARTARTSPTPQRQFDRFAGYYQGDARGRSRCSRGRLP